VADHYEYIAIVGIAAAVAAGLTTIANRADNFRGAARAAAVTLTALFVVLTWRQSRLYADAETLYRTTLVENPSSWLMHDNLALLLIDRGRLDEAVAHLKASVALNPSQVEAHNNLCHAGVNLGDNNLAIAECAESQRVLAAALARVGPSAALDDTRRTYRDGLVFAHNGRGTALAGAGRFAEAQEEFQAALRLDPASADAHSNLANVLMATHREAEAIDHYREAIRLAPNFALAHNNLGMALDREGHVDEAIREYTEALRLDPNLGQARARLDVLRARTPH